MQAIFNMRYPQTMPYLDRVYTDETTTQENREKAGDYIIQTRRALNQEVCFYSLGDYIWNDLGHTIYSQAVLFEKGRETIEAERERDGRPAAP